MIKWLKHLVQGIGIGIANLVPGVSGGTVALIFGIYEELISAAATAVEAGLSLVRFDPRSFAARVMELPYGFILPLAAGIVIVPIIGARIIPEAMATWPTQSRALFFGLILGSLAIPWIRIDSAQAREFALTLLAAVVAFVLVGFPPTEILNPTLVQIFFAATIAVSAMILPGVSGAFLLLVIGLYAPILRAIDARDAVVVSVFLAGSVSGLGVGSLVMKWLLSEHHDQTMAVLVGLMAGSLRALWPWLGDDRTLEWYGGGGRLTGVVLLFAAGLILSVAITVYELRKKKSKPPST
ncbi:MAG: DUF368 domain-containing protein [Rhodothermia bacterium]|nr:MAG: DUF368 domain-containing protein [Rhodothermia bacterium]